MFGNSLGRGGRAAARNHTVSVHVTSTISGRSFHRTFSWWAVRALIGVGVGLVLLMAVGIGGLVGWAGSTRRMRRLQTENDSLRIQFRRLGELEVNLARLSELNEQMQKMLGVSLPATDAETDSLAGVGGATDGGAKRSPGDQHDSPAGGEMDIPAAPGVSH